jgi:integrase
MQKRCHNTPKQVATIKLILDTRRTGKDGTHPIKFRIHNLRKYCDISTGATVLPTSFDPVREVVLDDDNLDDQLQQQRRTYEKRLRELTLEQKNNASPAALRNLLTKKSATEYTIDAFWLEEIERLQQCKRLGGAQVYRMTYNILKQEMNMHVPFSQFTSRDLYALETKLAQRGMKINSISVYMRTFKAICNKAIKQELVDYAWYPFRSFTIRKEKTVPRVLTMSEVKKFFELDIPRTEHIYKFWCIGKLLFMLRGINVRDLINLTPANIKNGRIIYRRAKTGKMYSILLMAEAEWIFNQFTDGHTLLSLVSKQDLQNETRLVKIYHQRSKIINKHLKKLGLRIGATEEITSYVFRYTFANIAKQMGYSKDLIAEALGHEYGNKVTGIYLEQFDQQLLDKMTLAIYERVNEDVCPF